MRRAIDKETADRMIEAYVSWREECGAVWDAYFRWSRSPSADAGLAFAAYQATLDRERRAADYYASVTQEVAPRADPPAEALRS